MTFSDAKTHQIHPLPTQLPSLTERIDITVEAQSQADQALENAVATVRVSATHHRVGIMVTRTAPGRYTVQADPAVPYGLTRQQDEWN